MCRIYLTVLAREFYERRYDMPVAGVHYCGAQSASWYHCTREANHEGDHIAHQGVEGATYLGRWPNA